MQEYDVLSNGILFGDPTNLAEIIRTRLPNTLLTLQVTSLQEAHTALSLNPDLLVLQGTEAGGHISKTPTPLHTFITETLSSLPTRPSIPILAAGGIVTGSQVAAALTLGADGAVIGTGLLATHESGTHLNAKKRIIRSTTTGEQTIVTDVPDVLRGMVWPEGISFRVLRNELSDGVEGRGEDVESWKGRWEVGNKAGDYESVAFVGCGMGVGSVRREESVQDVVDRVVGEAVASVQNVSQVVV
ncbi:hypothetical protein HDV00_003987 [Rhizophlyctis rosea]|nr:hypothetical protein HDV00_003987 [Rhizophlyctis rosea]